MAVRYISKGKGKNRKSFPIRPKKGVSIRSVSLQPSAIKKINKEQGRLLNKGESANFSKALNQVVIRAKRDGIPVYDTHVNVNDRRKPYKMWIVKHPEKNDKVKNSETIVMADSYGQAIDDFITVWNKENRMNKTIGYPVVQGTGEKTFRFKKDEVRLKRYNVCDPFLEDPASHKPDDIKHTNQIMYSLGDESCASVLTDEEFSMLLTDNQVANTFSPIGDTATKWQQDEAFRKRILDRSLELIEEQKESSIRNRKDDSKIIKEMFEAQQSKGDRLVDQIRHGDKVTIVKPNGQLQTGRAVMKSGAGDNSWVLNTGGEHGNSAIAFDDNVVKVVETR